MAVKKNRKNTRNSIYILAVIGVTLLLIASFQIGRLTAGKNLATGDVIEQARTDITNKYLAASSTKCTDPSDPIKPKDRVAVFYKYLRVNRLANRAVIRGCNDYDSLLMKTTSGWETTPVNLSLDTRANPAWQKACLIDDITRTDTVVRPENSSIDDMNLKWCNYMAVNDKVPPFNLEN